MPHSASKILESSDSLLMQNPILSIKIPLITSLLNQNNISLFCHLEETTMKTKTIDIFKTRFQKDHTSMSQNNVNNPNIIRIKSSTYLEAQNALFSDRHGSIKFYTIKVGIRSF